MRELGIPYDPEEPPSAPPPSQAILLTQSADVGLVKVEDIPIQADVPGHAVVVDLVVEVRFWNRLWRAV